MKHGRKGKLDFGDAHDKRVDTSSHVPGQQTQSDPKHHGQGNGGEPDADRDPGAIENRGKDIASLIVASEKKPGISVGYPDWRDVRIENAEGGEIERIVGCDDGREES